MHFHKNKKFLRLVLLFFSIYFIYHFVNGKRGLISWIQVSQKINCNEKTLKNLMEEQAQYRHLVNLLRPGKSVDSDLLEERARNLGYVYKDDQVIILDKERE